MAAEKKLPWLKPRHSQTGSMDPGRSLFTWAKTGAPGQSSVDGGRVGGGGGPTAGQVRHHQNLT